MSVVGFWEPEATSRGGIGQTIELKPDGSILMATAVIVGSAYRVDGGRLFVAEDSKALAAATSGVPFTVTGNLLVQTDPTGGEVRKDRLPPGLGTNPSLVGSWRYRHYTGAIAFERYTDDGRLLFRLPMTSNAGCYRTDGASISIVTPGVDRSMQYVVGGDRLTLRTTDGKSSTYRHAEPWYPRDQLDYQPPKTVEDSRNAADEPIRVTGVELTAQPSEYKGRCPTTIAFRGTVTVEGGPGTITYQFARSDGAVAPVQTLTVAVPGRKSVETTWQIWRQPEPTFEGWQRLIILTPARVESRSAGFTLTCR